MGREIGSAMWSWVVVGLGHLRHDLFSVRPEAFSRHHVVVHLLLSPLPSLYCNLYVSLDNNPPDIRAPHPSLWIIGECIQPIRPRDPTPTQQLMMVVSCAPSAA